MIHSNIDKCSVLSLEKNNQSKYTLDNTFLRHISSERDLDLYERFDLKPRNHCAPQTAQKDLRIISRIIDN